VDIKVNISQQGRSGYIVGNWL